MLTYWGGKMEEQNRDITIKEVANGYAVDIGGFTYVFKYLEFLDMMKFIGKKITGDKLKVEVQ